MVVDEGGPEGSMEWARLVGAFERSSGLLILLLSWLGWPLLLPLPLLVVVVVKVLMPLVLLSA